MNAPAALTLPPIHHCDLSHHALSHHALHTMPFRTMPFHTTPFTPRPSHDALSRHALSRHALSRHALSHHALSHHALSHHPLPHHQRILGLLCLQQLCHSCHGRLIACIQVYNDYFISDDVAMVVIGGPLSPAEIMMLAVMMLARQHF